MSIKGISPGSFLLSSPAGNKVFCFAGSDDDMAGGKLEQKKPVEKRKTAIQK